MMKDRFTSSLLGWLATSFLLFAVWSLLVVSSVFVSLNLSISDRFNFEKTESPFLLSIMVFLSNVQIFMPLVGMIIAVWLWRHRREREAALVLGTLAATVVINGVKLAFHQPCPASSEGTIPLWSDIMRQHFGVAGPRVNCYPSGHTSAYTLFWGFLAYLVRPVQGFAWPRNFAIFGIAILLLLIGPSRVFLGAHWFSDVVGGYLLGLTLLLFFIFLARRHP